MNPRLFPTLKELAWKRVIELNGIEQMERIIIEDEDAANVGIPVTVRGISVFKPFLTLTKTKLQAIMLAVVQGDLNQTETLIKTCPVLSSVKGNAIDYSRRTIKNLTPFQAALCALDNEMCEMLRLYMDDVEVTHQYQEIFPGHTNYFKAQTPFDFSTLIKVVTESEDEDVEAALDLKQNDSLLCQALNQFRTDFTLCSQRETVFNPKHLIRTFEIFYEQYDYWDYNQQALFWRQVIGYVERFLTANIAQDCGEGLDNRIRKKEKSKRSFDFELDGDPTFPLDFDSFSGLGFKYAFICRDGFTTDKLGLGQQNPRVFYLALTLQTYFEQKTSALQNVCNPPKTENGLVYHYLK